MASGEDPWTASPYKVKEGLATSEEVKIFKEDTWRIEYMGSLIRQFQEARYLVMEDKMTELQGLMDSLAT